MNGSYAVHPTCQMPAEVVNRIYLDAFGFKTNGVFVEIGAYDGRTYSFTWGLAMMGWKGLYVDPLERHVSACRRHHADHDVRVEEMAVGRHNEDAWFYTGGEVSSLKMDKVNRNWGLVEEKRVRVRVETLDTLLARVGWQKAFDLLIIDVEGAEEDVLRGFSKHVWKPRMIIVELHETYSGKTYLQPDGRNRAADFARGYFRGKYKKVHADMVNTVFVKEGNW